MQLTVLQYTQHFLCHPITSRFAITVVPVVVTAEQVEQVRASLAERPAFSSCKYARASGRTHV